MLGIQGMLPIWFSTEPAEHKCGGIQFRDMCQTSTLCCFFSLNKLPEPNTFHCSLEHNQLTISYTVTPKTPLVWIPITHPSKFQHQAIRGLLLQSCYNNHLTYFTSLVHLVTRIVYIGPRLRRSTPRGSVGQGCQKNQSKVFHLGEH